MEANKHFHAVLKQDCKDLVCLLIVCACWICSSQHSPTNDPVTPGCRTGHTSWVLGQGWKLSLFSSGHRVLNSVAEDLLASAVWRRHQGDVWPTTHAYCKSAAKAAIDLTHHNPVNAAVTGQHMQNFLSKVRDCKDCTDLTCTRCRGRLGPQSRPLQPTSPSRCVQKKCSQRLVVDSLPTGLKHAAANQATAQTLSERCQAALLDISVGLGYWQKCWMISPNLAKPFLCCLMLFMLIWRSQGHFQSRHHARDCCQHPTASCLQLPCIYAVQLRT